MPESTLSLTRAELLRAVGRYLGWDRNPSNWTSDQTTDGDDILNAGLRQFYTPPCLPDERTVHHWSFLEPTYQFQTIADIDTYDLPDLFGGFKDGLYCAPGDNAWFPLKETSIANILTLKSRDLSAITISSQPEWFCVEAQPTTGETPQRFSLTLFPATGGTFNLKGQYYINPYAVSSALTYPMGGQPHAETIQESCLAAAELQMNGEQGPHYAQFMVRLKASISFDRKATGPKQFGYNGDRSGGQCIGGRNSWTNPMTYNGVIYSGEET